MIGLQRIRREQVLREAEGYLELISAFGSQWSLPPSVRDPVAQRAIDALAKLDNVPGRRAHVQLLKGQALRAMERCREAVEPLKAATEFDNQNIEAFLALAWCYKRIGRLDLAIQALEEALAADAAQAIVHYNLACYWSLARNPKLAVAYLSRAFDLDTNYRDMVGEETDFDPIRNHPDFLALTSVIV